METEIATATEGGVFAYEKVHLSDFPIYDGDDNEGYQYGLHYGEYCPEEHSFEEDREVQWFQTEQERDAFITKELGGYTHIDEI